MFLFKIGLDNWASWATIVSGVAVIVSGIAFTYKKLKRNKLNIITPPVRLEASLFTDRKEIINMIMNKIQTKDSGVLLELNGLPGSGKSELAKAIKILTTSKVSNIKDKEFIELFNYEREKKRKSYIFTSQEFKMPEQVMKSIFEIFSIEIKTPSNLDVFSNIIFRKIKKNAHTIFIFDGVENLEVANAIKTIQDKTDSLLKLKHPNKIFSCIIIYSGAFSLANSFKNSNISRIENFSFQHTEEYLSKKISNPTDFIKQELHNITEGNIYLLNSISGLLNSGELDSSSLGKEQNFLSYIYTYIEEEKEVFREIVSICILDETYSPNEYELDLGNSKIQSSIEKLIRLDLILKSQIQELVISEKILILALNHDFLAIQQKLKNISAKKQSYKSIIGKLLTLNFSNPNIQEQTEILEHMKKNIKNHQFRDALRVSYFINSTFALKEFLKLNKEFYKEINSIIVEAFIGSGMYQAAFNLIRQEDLGFIIRPNKICSENFDQVFLVGNLYHLLNEYNKAIHHFEIMISSDVVENDLFYLAKCYWILAHCYRHKGDFENANHYYILSLDNCLLGEGEEFRLLSIKCMNERNSLFMYNNESVPYPQETIDRLILVPDSPEDLSTNKYRAIQKGAKGEFGEAIQLIDKTIDFYAYNKARLQYNLYFEKGELLRRKKEFQNAVSFLKKALESAQQNGDKNIQLYSMLGILAVELESNCFYATTSKQEQKQWIDECSVICHDDESEDIRFKLGLSHLEQISKIYNGVGDTAFFKKILPLL